MKPLASGPFVAPTSSPTSRRPATAGSTAVRIAVGMHALVIDRDGQPSTLAPCTVVDDVPTALPSTVKCTSAIEVIESIVIRPPRSRTPFSRDSGVRHGRASPRTGWRWSTGSSRPRTCGVDGLSTVRPGDDVEEVGAGSGNPVAPPPGAPRGACRSSSSRWPTCRRRRGGRPAPPSPWPAARSAIRSPRARGRGRVLVEPSAAAPKGHCAVDTRIRTLAASGRRTA